MFMLHGSVRRAALVAIGLGTLQVIGAGPVSAATSDITEFRLPTADSTPEGITAGPDGNLWFAEQAGRIGRITPAGVVTEFSNGITADSRPFAITAGPDGNLWFTEDSAIGRITPAGDVTEFGITSNSAPEGITAGPDGNLWFTEDSAIGRITPTGVVTEFSNGITVNSMPRRIAAGADGNLWFTEWNIDRIGRITPTGTVTQFATGITEFSGVRGITAGPDGNVWFTEVAGDRIGRIEVAVPQATVSPASHDFGEQEVGTSSGLQQFTVANTGTGPLIVGAAGIGGTDPGDFGLVDDQCSGATVAPGGTCTIGVTFTPGTVGARAAVLTVSDNASDSPHTAAVTGVGIRAVSAVQLTASPNPSTSGDPVTFAAQVSTAAPVTPTGSVTFTDGTTSLGTAVVDGTGKATVTSSALPGGAHQITASYSGDAKVLGSSASIVQQVTAAPTALTARPAQLVIQLPGASGLRLAARLTLTHTGAPIGGQLVSMRINGATVCTATTASDGVATCTAPVSYLLAVTVHGYTAAYAGSPDYQPATGHAGLLG